MKQNFLLKTMLLLCALIAGSGSAWADVSVPTPEAGTFVIDFYDSEKLSSTSGTGLTNSNYSSFVGVATGLTKADVVTGVSVTGTVRYGMNGGLTAGTGTAASADSHYVTFSIGSDYAVTKCTVYATAYESGRWLLNGNAAGSGSLGSKGATLANVTSPLVWDNLGGVTSLTFKKDNGSGGNQKRLTIYRIVCEYSTGGGDLNASDLTITNQSTALSFDLYNNSSAQVINYTTSSTGAITIEPASPTSYFSYVHDATNKTITVTPSAVTSSAQTVKISQEADATYAAGSKTFTVTITDSTPLGDISVLTSKSAGDYTVSLTDALVTYVHGNNAYLEDASGAVLLYGCKGDLAAGDKITGTANVTLTIYNGLPEVTAITLASGYTKTSGNTVTPTEVTITNLKNSYSTYLSRYIKIVGATVTSAFSSKNSTIEQEGSSIVMRDQNSSATLTTTVNDIVTVTAHPSIYNTTQQIAVYEQSQIEVAKVNPPITFNNGSVRVGATLDLSTLFESNSTGAVTYSITAGGSYATIDGSTLTGNAEGSVTVKAAQAESSSYNAGEATATITVNPALVLSSIAVTTAPTKTTYNEGETFDPTGMVVTATYTDNSAEAVTGYTCSPDGALTTSDTEITISYTESGVTKTTTQAITVNEVVDYATLPFSFDKGRADIEDTDGLTQEGLDSDYASSPKLKFNSAGDYVILKINERPGVLTFDIKGNSLSGTYKFTVLESDNGTDYSTLKEYTNIGSSTTSETLNPAATTRYIKWEYTTKANGNVALGNIALAAYVAPGNSAPVWSELPTPTIAVNEEYELNLSTYVTGTPTPTISLSTSVSSSLYEFEDGLLVFQPTAAGTYEFTFTAENSEGDDEAMLTVTAAEVTTYTLASSITSGKHYVIANGTSDEVKVMSTTQNNNNRGAADGSVSGTTLSVESNAGAAEVVIYGPDTDGLYAIYDAAYDSNNGGYLYAISNYNYLRTQGTNNASGLWTIAIDESTSVATIKVSFVSGETTTDRLMRYNSSNKIFSCYTSGQQPIYLYEKDGEAAPTESKTLNGSGYATYCSQNALDFTGNSDVTAWVITAANSTTGVITFSQITGKAPAGTGMLLKGTPNAPVTLTSATGKDALESNLLVGITSATNVTAGQYYGLSGNTFVPVNTGTVPAGKALLPADALSSNVKAFTFVFEDDDPTGINTVNGEGLMVNDPIYNLAGQRISKMQKGINIVNGKKVLK